MNAGRGVRRAVALLLLLAGAASASPWFTEDSRPTAVAHEALALLSDAAADGLAPHDYDAAALAARLPDAAWAAALEAALQRYLRHLHAGRVSPRELGFRVVATPPSDAELAQRLAAAAARGALAPLVDDLRPPLAQYRHLRAALARYRLLADGTPLPALPALGIGPAVPPGQEDAAAAALRQRLIAFGDLSAQALSPDPGGYDAVLADAVRRFQARHGLEPDGVLGRATLAELNVAPALRVRQIELALERLRWLPRRSGRPVIAVNIPMYRLWAWDRGADDDRPSLSMGVIVGKAMRTRTPVFADELRYLVFRPYWNVPRSIVRDELLPAIARDPTYLARHDMELSSVPGDELPRIRQRPGPKNALGLVKFIFPNDANVYLHGTPAPQLFARSRRDFSHGCVRVEDPAALAHWLLQGQPDWSREAIVAAMEGGSTRQVDLPEPVPVLLYYLTAMVAPEDGTLRFAADVYGHDRALERALARRARR
jgi:murein L,D-transpeptidase YcbB/YkuD